jgi:hypothetical protein
VGENMMTKTMVVSLFALSLLALTGIGYAAFTSSIIMNGSGNAGTLSIVWGNSVSTAAYDESGNAISYATCTYSGAGTTTLTLSANNLGPGDYCIFRTTITNTGTIPGTMTITNWGGITGYDPCQAAYPNMCFYQDDTFHNQGDLQGTAAGTSGLPTPPVNNENIPIGNGASVPYVSVMQLHDNAPNGAMGLTDWLTETLTASH